jgi:hypothetical protein
VSFPFFDIDVAFPEPGKITGRGNSREFDCVYDARGFNEVTNANGGVPFFHLWTGSTASVNTAATGLGSLGVSLAFNLPRHGPHLAFQTMSSPLPKPTESA